MADVTYAIRSRTAGRSPLPRVDGARYIKVVTDPQARCFNWEIRIAAIQVVHDRRR